MNEGQFYFLLIRPQQKKVKDHKLMVAALKRGDEVVTSGGIVGKIERVLDVDVSDKKKLSKKVFIYSFVLIIIVIIVYSFGLN